MTKVAPSSARILLLGTDGAGKTTTARLLLQQLGEGNGEYVYFGMKEYRLRLTAALHEKPGLRRLLYNYIIYPLDLALRRSALPKDRPLVFDRFPYYPFVQAGLLRWIYRSVLPTVDLAVWLQGDPQILFARKGEKSPQALARDQEKIERTLPFFPASRTMIINVDATPADEVAAKILRELHS